MHVWLPLGGVLSALPSPSSCPPPPSVHALCLPFPFPHTQFNLFGGTVLKLGTKRHHDLLQRGITTLDDIGCFALTELGYGGLPLLACTCVCLLPASSYRPAG